MGTGRPFQPGNTEGKGRPPGSRNQRTIFQEALEIDGEKIIEVIKRRAMKSNSTAMRLCMERLLPLAKASNARFRLPPVGTAAELTAAISAVTQAVAEGELSPQEGESVARVIESQRRNIEVAEFDARIRILEKASKGRRED